MAVSAGWLVALALLAAEAKGPPPKPIGPPLPSDAQCPALPATRAPLPFGPGEVLDFDLDALGMRAGTMRMAVRAGDAGTLGIRVDAESNTLFSKIRKVTGLASSVLNARTLRPVDYVDDATENGLRKYSAAKFHPAEHRIDLDWIFATQHGKTSLHYGNEGLDLAGAVYLLRSVPWKVGQPACFNVYAIRRVWRLVGKVEAKEHVSLPLGEFEAWHLSGVAIRLDDPNQRREVHVWISDDARRLPLVAVGAIDLGAVRATLTGVRRPGEQRAKAEDPKRALKW